MPTDDDAFFARLYDAFNRRDVATVLAALTEDVHWANGWEGGHVQGRAAVADYWRRQWEQIDPTVEPVGVARDALGRAVVQVRQTVRDRSGALLGSGDVRHVYTFDGDRVARMDIDDAP